MRAVQVISAGGPFNLVEREIPDPAPRQVRIRIEACGVCHSDVFTKGGLWPGIQYPRTPGHEIAGVIDAVGASVPEWRAGQRVGVGWHGGHCGYCEPCRRGDFVTCRRAQIPGISYEGGYADYVVVPFEALANIPDRLSAVDASPLMCAGITTFNSLRNSGARPGELVAVLGVGGLGHLGVQFASKMGFRTVAIARGQGKAELAKELGAQVYIDSEAENVPDRLQQLGGARIILATAASGEAMTAAVGGLGVNGKLIVLGASADPISVSSAQLIGARRVIQGWPSGTSIDSQDTMAFSTMNGVRSMTETFPLERAGEAYQRMIDNKARFRVVLTTGSS
jgi:D-arabinose 1-dehydrogenase-like Zn-dependent alcohol dehydrogenase